MRWTSANLENAKNFVRALEKEGFNLSTGVPCSLLGALLEELRGNKKCPYYPAVREDAAIGLASGAYLAGAQPVVLIQNSGLGYSLNVLTSLNLIYGIPVLLLITYRGQGPDAPEHIVMGRSCVNLLKEIGIETAVPEAAELANTLRHAKETMHRSKKPFAIMIQKGIFGQ
ncbi:MAG: sulfopyruvate decarboxylase subunit alpha [Micavibrio sp.]|nr:sulfopyruvate decarboxylase subunit alpha [Micavibrio sp.]